MAFEMIGNFKNCNVATGRFIQIHLPFIISGSIVILEPYIQQYNLLFILLRCNGEHIRALHLICYWE